MIYRRPSSVPATASTVALRSWTMASEAEAREDIGRLYAWKPDGPLVDREIARLLSGQEVYGRTSIWTTEPATVGSGPVYAPAFRCPVCDFRTLDASMAACVKCGEGRMAELGSMQRDLQEVSRT